MERKDRERVCDHDKVFSKIIGAIYELSPPVLRRETICKQLRTWAAALLGGRTCRPDRAGGRGGARERAGAAFVAFVRLGPPRIEGEEGEQLMVMKEREGGGGKRRDQSGRDFLH